MVATGIPHGTWTLTAANGDQLFLDMTGYGIDDHHGFGQFTVTGGTGRFEGATGEAAFQSYTPDFHYAEVTFEGTVSY